MEQTLSLNQLILVTLLVKLAFMAAIGSLLGRFQAFKRLLYKGELSPKEKLVFALLAGALLSLGVMIRLLLGYNAADLSLSGTVLVGLLTGPFTGAAVGLMVGAPAAMQGEWFALALGVLYGVVGGIVRELCRKEDIWSFSPFVFLNLYRIGKTAIRDRIFDWQIAIFAVTVGLESLRIFIGEETGNVFHLYSPNAWVMLAIYLTTLACLGIPLKIWNSIRLEQKLADQEVMVVRARLQALSSQINPHFLFNTLNSISSAIRTDPDMARGLVRKLSNILRKLLREQDNFVPLKEELEFIDSYLDIESVRFGSGKLEIRKEIEPDALETVIPAMIVQPLVENAIKHGISKRLEGGRIIIRARQDNGAAIIEIEDNGGGLPLTAEHGDGLGIGLTNVSERLNVIYGDKCRFQLSSLSGRGTLARLEIPEVDRSKVEAS